MRLFAGPAPRLFRRMVDCRSRRSFWLRRCRAARSPWSGQHVRTSRIGRRLLDGWVHLFRTNDAVRPVQVFAQALGRRSRVGAGGGCWSWRRAGRLGECRVGDEDDVGDQQAKSRADGPHAFLNPLFAAVPRRSRATARRRGSGLRRRRAAGEHFASAQAAFRLVTAGATPFRST